MSVFTHASSYLRRSLSFLRSRRTNAERSAWPRLIALLLITASVGVLGGCYIDQGSDSDSIAVTGQWKIDGSGFYERWTITSSSVHYESSTDGTNYDTVYRADVVDFVNGRLNAGDTALTNGGSEAVNPGFVIIQYTAVDGAGTGEVGKYNVFRWAQNSNDTAERNFTQGYKDADGSAPYINAVFDTPAAAETGATNAAGYFAFASSGAERTRF